MATARALQDAVVGMLYTGVGCVVKSGKEAERILHPFTAVGETEDNPR